MISAQRANSPYKFDKECLICERPAYCRHYGVTSCDACKMFFRRVAIEKISYSCRKSGKCLERKPIKRPLCRACRLQKCIDSGMVYVPESEKILEVANRAQVDSFKLLTNMLAMHSKMHVKLMQYYTKDDPSLEDILNGKRTRVKKKKPQLKLRPEQWSFFDLYILVSSFKKLDFVKNLTSNDKLILFRNSIMRVCILGSSMRALQEGKDHVGAPDGQEIYPPELADFLKIDPVVLKRICDLLVTRLIELRMTNEEFILFRLILFCNPAIPSLSDDGRSVLSTYQKTYTSILLQYCQQTYQQSAPSRLTDLLSLCHVINKSYEDVTYLVMTFQMTSPVQGFKYHRLSLDLFQL